ncbi:nuclear transport factor 2 family protein [Chitinophaga nivalis]|uniref:Nuclear transport factor 2 family protein n=1 Tax=Chitinophaga nivalis TaxID=2991709 RepID=A0ABT3ITV3_9BACT|nr:nuclear transport factor 2 family protein [Chitinophaga nivalis]MCW3462904.1 nuclear transport factor 2 family protein [Chitinophaga nivalis]MCW3487406.1 nuclear transport factor 2 family protein [Chitinophaga nivalis]
MENLTAFGQAWLDAWNSHQLDDILSHYADDVVFYSPFIQQVNNDPSGCIHGKTALRAYFSRALTVYPELHFELYHILEGVSSVVLYYKSVGNRLSAEMMVLNAAGEIQEVRAHYK